MVYRCGICGKLEPSGQYAVDGRGLVLCGEHTGYARPVPVHGRPVLECSCGYRFESENNRIWFEEHRCANCGSTDEVAVYLHMLSSWDRVDPRSELSWPVMERLARFTELRVVGALIGVLEDNTVHERLKVKAAEALGEIGDPSALSALKKARPRLSLMDFVIWLSAFPWTRVWPPSTDKQWGFDDAIGKLQAKADET